MTSSPKDSGPRDERGVVAVITSAHGVRGQVKIHPFIENPEALFSAPITDATGNRPFKLTRHGIKGTSIIASIEGITDRNQAELLKGTELFAPAAIAASEKDKLTGLEARLLNGNVYGRVIGLYNFGAGDILDIEMEGGKSEMLPFTDNFVGGVHAEEGYLVVFPPEYVETDKD